MRLKFWNTAKYFYLTEKPEKMPAYFLKSVAYNLLSNLITAQNLDLELGGLGGGGWCQDLDLGIWDFVRTSEKSLACYVLVWEQCLSKKHKSFLWNKRRPNEERRARRTDRAENCKIPCRYDDTKL